MRSQNAATSSWSSPTNLPAAIRHHRHPRHDPRPRPRRHPDVAYEATRPRIKDVLRLSRGMTYKAAVAGLNLGGGKAVIIGNPKRTDRESCSGPTAGSSSGSAAATSPPRTSARARPTWSGSSEETNHVTGSPGLSRRPVAGDRARRLHRHEGRRKARGAATRSQGKTVAVQGVRQRRLLPLRHLKAEGVKMFVTDIDEERVKRVVEANRGDGRRARRDLRRRSRHLRALRPRRDRQRRDHPAAQGGDHRGRRQQPARRGAARRGRSIERGILYAPDYVINAGGLINVYGELQGWTMERAKRKAGEIYDTMLRVFDIAAEEKIPTIRRRIGWPRSGSSRSAGCGRCGWPGKAIGGSAGTRGSGFPASPRPRYLPAHVRSIPIASDHAGFEIRSCSKRELRALGLCAEDVGHQSAATPRTIPTSPIRSPRGRARRGAARRAALRHRAGHVVRGQPAPRRPGRRGLDARGRRSCRGSTTTPTSWCCRPAAHARTRASKILQRWLSTPFDRRPAQRRVAKIEEGE